jgi:hypothetical protein
LCPICFEDDGGERASTAHRGGQCRGAAATAHCSRRDGGILPPSESEKEATGGNKRKFLVRGRYGSHGLCKAYLDKILLLVHGDDGAAAAEAPPSSSGIPEGEGALVPAAQDPLGLIRQPRQFQSTDHADGSVLLHERRRRQQHPRVPSDVTIS